MTAELQISRRCKSGFPLTAGQKSQDCLERAVDGKHGLQGAVFSLSHPSLRVAEQHAPERLLERVGQAKLGRIYFAL